MSYTKANVADVGAAQTSAAAAGSAATESAQRGTALSTEVSAGVEEVTAALLRHVHHLADTLRGHAAMTGQQLAGADWEGRARESALVAERTLHARLDATTAAAEEGTATLRQSLDVSAQELVASVQQGFAAVLGQVDVAYQDLSAAQAAFAEQLASADAAARF